MTDSPPVTRRHLLTRLGLATGAAYAAPVMLHLDAARASGVSGRSLPSRSYPSVSSPSRARRRGDDAALRRRLRDAEAQAEAALLRRLFGL
jgi:hypothetical protein